MKVADFMNKPISNIPEEASIKEAIRLMLAIDISGLAVTRGKKIVGTISEADILTHLYPSQKEFNEERLFNFESMEENMKMLLPKKIKRIMKKNILHLCVRSDSPLTIALNIMMNNKLSHLPVLNHESEIIGIISQGDVFRSLFGTEIPHRAALEFDDWIAHSYDRITDWKKRLGSEIPGLASLFKRHGGGPVVDIASGTGEHTIALAKKGFNVTGLETSSIYFRQAQKKFHYLPSHLKERVRFYKTEYDDFFKSHPSSFDHAILLGNALAHYPEIWKDILTSASKAIKKNGNIVIQLKNYQKILKYRNGVDQFYIETSGLTKLRQYTYFRFISPHEDHDKLHYCMSIIGHDGIRWSFRGSNSTVLAHLSEKNVVPELTRRKFGNIRISGNVDGAGFLSKEFNPSHDDWLTISAKKL